MCVTIGNEAIDKLKEVRRYSYMALELEGYHKTDRECPFRRPCSYCDLKSNPGLILMSEEPFILQFLLQIS